MPPGEQFSWSSRRGVGVVHPVGEVDLYTVERFRECCQAKRLQADEGWLRFIAANADVIFGMGDGASFGQS